MSEFKTEVDKMSKEIRYQMSKINRIETQQPERNSTMNYKARGELKAFCFTRLGWSLIIADVGTEFVVSEYKEGSSEWAQGHYFSSWSKAVKDFTQRVLEATKGT